MKYKNIPLKGTLFAHEDLPGDKSISHRALIFSALANSSSRIFGLNTGEDVRYTQQALKAIGVTWTWHDHILECHGRPQFWLSPQEPIYLGNSGTSARLLAGLMAGLPITITLTGDLSLSKRPMERVIAPLLAMGACITAENALTLPLTIKGCPLTPQNHYLKIPSAQIKSALLLAGMHTTGTTTIGGEIKSRDHTERMMAYLNIPLEMKEDTLNISGPIDFKGRDLSIPADPSAAAFFAVAAMITPHSHIKMTGISWNPYRCQIFHVLQKMGGKIEINNHRILCGEPVVDIEVYASDLAAIETMPNQAPSLIDEFPILAIAASQARGSSLFRGLGELRHKESDRLHAMASNLQQLGYQATITGDNLHITGQSNQPKKKYLIKTFHDHRIAMSFRILNHVYPGVLTLDDTTMIKTSFPKFDQCLKKLLS